MSNLYRIDGSVIPISGGDGGVAIAANAKKAHGTRTNLVQTHGYTDAGATTWMESGFHFRRTKSWITSFKFDFKIEITGTATAFYAKCTGADSMSEDHTYESGEQSYSDTFSNVTKMNAEFIDFYIVLATTANESATTRIATARTLKLASIPDGLELIGEYFNRCPTLTTHTLTFDEAKTYPSMVSRWQGRRWIAMGDSITQGVSPYYHGVAGQMLQFESVTNAGMGGTSLVQWANGLLETTSYRAKDLVTIMHGVNDHDNSPNSPIGELAPHGSTFDKSTYIGAYQYIIETIQANSPITEIIILGSTTVNNDAWVNNVGADMDDYRAAAKAVAEDYDLPYFNCATVITPENYQSLTRDGIHLNETGQEVLGKALAKWMVTI